MRAVPGLLCIFVCFATLGIAVGSKKDGRRRSKGGREKVKHRPVQAVVQNVRASIVDHPQSSQLPPFRAAVSQCEARDKQYNELVGKFNKLLKEHNDLQKYTQGIIVDHNKLVAQLNDPSVEIIHNFISQQTLRTYHHPGIEGAHNKTLKYVLPVANRTMYNLKLLSDMLVNETETNVQNFLYSHASGTVIDPWIPALSTFVVQACIIVPVALGLSFSLYYLCVLDQLLLIFHTLISFLALFVIYVGVTNDDDPLSFLAEQNYNAYQFMQVSFAVMYLFYSFLVFLSTFDNCARCLELLVALWIGIGYYFLVWTPAMLDQMPAVNSWMKEIGKERVTDVDSPVFSLMPYELMCCFFFILTLFDIFGCPGGDDKVDPKNGDCEGGKAD